MTTQAAISTKPKTKFSFRFGKKHKLLIGYLSLLALPFLATQMLDMDYKGRYATLLSLVNTLAVMAFFIQFPLGSRIKHFPLFANIDWNIKRHKQVGKWHRRKAPNYHVVRYDKTGLRHRSVRALLMHTAPTSSQRVKRCDG